MGYGKIARLAMVLMLPLGASVAFPASSNAQPGKPGHRSAEKLVLTELPIPPAVIEKLSERTDDHVSMLSGRITGATEGVTVAVEAAPTELEALAERERGIRDRRFVAAGTARDGSYEVPISTKAAAELKGRDILITTYSKSGFVLSRSSISVQELPGNYPGFDAAGAAAPVKAAAATLPSTIQHDIGIAAAPESIEVERVSASVAAADTGESSDLAVANAGYPPGSGCGPTSSCCVDEFKHTVVPWVLIATAGTNTRYAHVSARFEYNATSKLGWHFKSPGNSNWQVSGGTITTTNSGQTQAWAETNRYGLNTYEMTAAYDVWIERCWLYTGIYNVHNEFLSGAADRKPVGYLAGDRSQLWFGEGQYYPGWCLQKSAGTYTLSTTKARSYPTGVQFSPLGASSESGYSSRVELQWRFTANKYLCGETNFPGFSGGDSGKIMADWANR
jgi:hypothetical protein